MMDTIEVLSGNSISELTTPVVIKVCYVSPLENRNGTIIDYEVGKQLAATLPGAPIVGFFNEETGDFEEHSKCPIVKDGMFEFKDLTRPYGFVSPIESPWYQDFLEDGVVRKYLMCKGYLWTRQYEEASLAANKKESMDLREDYSGYYDADWCFIFTQAEIDKLTILGDDFEPCFEGASITPLTYALIKDAEQQDQQELTALLERRYFIMGGQLINTAVNAENPVEGTITVPTGTADPTQFSINVNVNGGAESAESAGEPAPEPSAPTGEFAKKDNEELETKINDLMTQFTVLQESLTQKDSKISELESQIASYSAEKKARDDIEKESILATYTKVLTTEEMKPIVDKKADYSAAEVERELALVFSRKQMTKPEPAMQFSIREPQNDIPTFMQDVLDYEKTHII